VRNINVFTNKLHQQQGQGYGDCIYSLLWSSDSLVTSKKCKTCGTILFQMQISYTLHRNHCSESVITKHTYLIHITQELLISFRWKQFLTTSFSQLLNSFHSVNYTLATRLDLFWSIVILREQCLSQLFQGSYFLALSFESSYETIVLL